MSAANEDDKDSQKSLPLDLARNQISAVRTMDGKAPIVMAASQSLRNMRVLTQGSVSTSGATSGTGPTIITTNIVPQAVLKPGETGRTQIATIITSSQGQSQVSGVSGSNITIQRPTQITLSSAPVVAQNVASGTTYHVPRGAAVVANLTAPRSNVTTVRAPMVVAAQTALQVHSFVRPPRTPSPAQGTAWLTTNSSNGSQIKGAPTVLSSPVRGATVTGKPQLVTRTQPGGQAVSSLRTGTILHSAITIGQPGQLHSYKPGQNTSGIQTLGSTVTIAQVLPTRTQAVVYNTNTSAQFTPAPRLTVSSTSQNQRQVQAARPLAQVTTTRLAAMPVTVAQTGTRLLTPQTTVLTSATRISAVSTLPQQTTVIPGSTPARLVSSTQPSVTIGRLSVASSPAQVTNANVLGQPKLSTLNLQSLVPVVSSAQVRGLQTQGPKVITQPAPGIHLTSLPANTIKTTQATPGTTRTINVPTAIVNQRQATVLSSTIPIAKVYQQTDSQQSATSTSGTNVFIHTNLPSVPRRTSPSHTSVPQSSSSTPATTVATYSLASNTYFYDQNYARNFSPQSSVQFTPVERQNQSQPVSSLGQVHGVVGNQQMRFNPVMVVDQGRQPYSSQAQISGDMSEQTLQASLPTKVTSSPRPSILRKRDHEGSPLKAAKNLSPVLANLPRQQPTQQPPVSPPPRPDSRGNGHSSGGSTTISATSSPGLAELNDDSMPDAPVTRKEEESKPPEVSPRKKPRKQQLTGNDLDEHNDDMQFISESTLKKEEISDDNQSDEPRDGAPEAGGRVTQIRKPASASLLNSYRQNWKATHNHYLRYSDVRPKEERRPTIVDLANQYRVQEKVNGWKIHHLSTQMEDLAEQEQAVYDQLTQLLKFTESEESSNFDKEVNRVNELIKGNLQRIKIINDGMIEAKTQIMKIFNHKVHVTDIINRCASKRNYKKREKS